MNPTNFNPTRKDLYSTLNPEYNDRTQKRLNEIYSLGIQEVGLGEFGVKGIVSGLYIEKVWNYSDKDFNDYLNFVKDTVLEHELARI